MKNRIKELREEMGLTQEELATMIETPDKSTTARVISYYESGERSFSLQQARTMANLFKCSVDYLVGDTDIRTNKLEVNQLYLGVVNDCDKNDIPPEQLQKVVEFLKNINKK